MVRAQQLDDMPLRIHTPLLHKIQIDTLGIDALYIGVSHDVAVSLRQEDLDHGGVGAP